MCVYFLNRNDIEILNADVRRTPFQDDIFFIYEMIKRIM